MGAQRACVVGILLIAGSLLGGASAPLRAQGHFGLSAGLYQPEGDDLDRTETFGLRGGYRFSPSLGLEASLSRVDLADTIPFEDDPSFPGFDFDFQLDLYDLDLSLQWFPRGSSFVIFAGPGAARLDAEVHATVFGQAVAESKTADIFTAHAGFGYEWQIGERFFVRPEARVRRYFDDDLDEEQEEGLDISYDATDYEAGLTLGWRLGS